MKVRVCCPECRTTFDEPLNRVIHSDCVRCPTRRDERHFHGIGQVHDHESMADYIHHVAEHTCHPQFSLGRRPSIYLLVYDFVGKLLPSFRHHALVNKLRRPLVLTTPAR